MGTGNTAENKNILVQSFFGVKGSLFGDWNWDVQGSAGRATVWQAFLNVPVIQNFNAAAYAVKDASGNIVCGPTSAGAFSNSGATAAQLAAAPSPGCVPYNPFGVPSAASVNYITNIPTGPDGSEANLAAIHGTG